jgi:hypothetical protein
MDAALPLLDGRTRTLLQSFDTARFQKVEDGSQAVNEEAREGARLNRLLDTAHARTEVLSALVMGYEIVVPAGVIGDCVAFLDLFTEVMAGRDAAGVSSAYRPFRMGLEARFAPDADMNGYAKYLTDFADNYRADLVQLGIAEGFAPADATIASKEANIKALVALYKARNFTALDKARPGFGEYVERMHLEMCDAAGAPPVVALCDPFSDMEPDYYSSEFEHYRDNVWDREGVDRGRVLSMVDRAKAVCSRLPSPGQRGQWYKRQQDFEDLWPEARTWLDHGLYGLMARSFGVSVPSFFAQQTHDDPHSDAIALAFLDDDTFSSFTRERDRRQPTCPPIASDVVWSDIWSMIADDDFARSAADMQAQMADAYMAEAGAASWTDSARRR